MSEKTTSNTDLITALDDRDKAYGVFNTIRDGVKTLAEKLAEAKEIKEVAISDEEEASFALDLGNKNLIKAHIKYRLAADKVKDVLATFTEASEKD